jgi:hypothetical protein
VSDLYASGFAPPRVKPEWERCSMTLDSSRRLLGPLGEGLGVLTDCVGWFDELGQTRIVVADFDNGRRMVCRFLSRSTKITFERWKALSEPAEATP